MLKTKHALVIGIDYDGDLPGCIHDADRMENFLLDQDYSVYKICGQSATWNHIVWAITAICGASYTGMFQELFIYYSGHGTRVTDTTGDELDGHDEAIVTSDNYAISDDLFHTYLSWVPSWVKVKILMDCCHSGTAMDLAYRWYPETDAHMRNYMKSYNADIQMISGCMDDQVANEVTVNGTPQGVMTTLFLAYMRGDLSNWSKDIARKITESLAVSGWAQRPLFSSSREIS